MSSPSQRRVYLKRTWIGVSVASLLVAVAFTIVGKMNDCRPDETDGQCGLSTFIGAFHGGILVVTTQLAMGLISYVLTFWWDRHPVENEQEAD